MKSGGIIHPELAMALASLGHTDRICIADAGLPVPPGVYRIDLAYRLGAPLFVDVMQALAPELVAEEVTFAEEALDHCPEIVGTVHDLFPGAARRTVPHAAFKIETQEARLIIRTGETTPYANVMLRSGVPFG